MSSGILEAKYVVDRRPRIASPWRRTGSPAFGLLWGALLLAEPLGLGTFFGLGLILASIALVIGAALPRVAPRQ